MKSFVITIKDIPQSVQAAERCIASAKDYNILVEMFDAITPKDNPLKILEEKGINPEGLRSEYSRFENCAAAFLSHYSLWEKCADDRQDYLILEHDAVFVNKIPDVFTYDKLVSFAAPSYGKHNTPNKLGIGPLTSKPYLPGAHAYLLNKEGAKILIEKAKTKAAPTDVFINLQNFPWIQEYYPWAVEAQDSFTTIQKDKGCLAKHSYKEGYKII